MKHLAGLAILSLSLVLTACGGDSDSSGSNNAYTSEPLRFSSLSFCKIANNTIYIGKEVGSSRKLFVPGECKVKTPKLNKGKVFSLKCLGTDLIDIQTTKDGDIDSVKNDIRTFEMFKYQCA